MGVLTFPIWSALVGRRLLRAWGFWSWAFPRVHEL